MTVATQSCTLWCTQCGGTPMRFVSVRELRSQSAKVWRDLAEEGELVITTNGKPIAIVSATDGQDIERSLRQLRRVRAIEATEALRAAAARSGRDKMSAKDIQREIDAARRGRR